MRKEFILNIEIPEKVEIEFDSRSKILKFRKGDLELEKKSSLLGSEIIIEKNYIKLICRRANKKNIASIKSLASHINNILEGMNKKFVYEMEICNVHFPITAKVDENKVVISNFLGEKINRTANILPGVDVEINGNKITISSHNKESAGQSMANLEKASKVRGRDRRIFQDGIFLTNKPGGDI